MKRSSPYMLFLALLFGAGTANATHHGWQIVEVFSNTDGTLQFIEMQSAVNGHASITCCKVWAFHAATNEDKDWNFTSNLPSTQTAGKSLLIATAGFEAAFGIAPDYIIPDNYLATGQGDVFYNNTLAWDTLATDGVDSYSTGGVRAAGTPKNFSDDEMTMVEQEPQTTATAYLMTTSSGVNVTTLHIINTSDDEQSFTGTLYSGAGDQLGDADTQLHQDPVVSRGRVAVDALDLESLFGIEPWSGPAMLEVTGSAGFELMGKLTSPSGLISNTNCVRENRVLNLEGEDSSDMTFIRFINTTESDMGAISGSLYDSEGNLIGSADTELLSGLVAKQAVWINRKGFEDIFGAWNGEALLEVDGTDGLKLLNLNFVNGETFFNFSCFETSGSGDVYLMTTSSSNNVSRLHIVNTSTFSQAFTGTLYNGSGEQQGSASESLSGGMVAPKGRVVLTAEDLESVFGVSAWKGPALLRVSGNYDFELMIKLESPSGLISNTNCVRQDEVHNIEGFDTQDVTYVRFINIGNSAISNITGTLYDADGNVIGSSDIELLSSLAAKQAVWINRNSLSDLVGDTWNGEALLRVSSHTNLRLLNLNFINSETFFNFSCYESSIEDE